LSSILKRAASKEIGGREKEECLTVSFLLAGSTGGETQRFHSLHRGKKIIKEGGGVLSRVPICWPRFGVSAGHAFTEKSDNGRKKKKEEKIMQEVGRGSLSRKSQEGREGKEPSSLTLKIHTAEKGRLLGVPHLRN